MHIYVWILYICCFYLNRLLGLIYAADITPKLDHFNFLVYIHINVYVYWMKECLYVRICICMCKYIHNWWAFLDQVIIVTLNKNKCYANFGPWRCQRQHRHRRRRRRHSQRQLLAPLGRNGGAETMTSSALLTASRVAKKSNVLYAEYDKKEEEE